MDSTAMSAQIIPAWWPPALGALIGALLAFVFAVLLQHMIRNHDRWRKHCNGLVQLEAHLNELLQGISDNLFQIEDINTRPPMEHQKRFHFTFPHELPVDKTAMETLMNPEVIYEFFCLNISITKYNHDVSALGLSHEALWKNLLGGNITWETFLDNELGIMRGLKLMKSALEEIDASVFDLLARVRVQMDWDKRRRIWSCAMQPMSLTMRKFDTKRNQRNSSKKSKQRQLEDERVKLRNEITGVQAKSRERKKRLFDEMS